MAARTALERLFRTDVSAKPLVLGDAGKSVDYEPWAAIANVSISHWTTKACEERLKQRTHQRVADGKERQRRVSSS